MTFTVTVELVRALERGGRVHQPGDRINVPIAEATSMFDLGFARPIGAPASWGEAPRAAWVKAWRSS
jgi:hypothetical protein